MNTGVNRESITRIEVRMTMENTLTETMGSTMVNNTLTITIDQIDQTDQTDQTEERDQGAQVETGTTEEMTAQGEIEAEEEIDRREDIAPMKEAKGDNILVKDEDTAQRPMVMLGLL